MTDLKTCSVIMAKAWVLNASTKSVRMVRVTTDGILMASIGSTGVESVLLWFVNTL